MVALFITLVTGRVLFTYNRVSEYSDIDLKPFNTTSIDLRHDNIADYKQNKDSKHKPKPQKQKH